AFRERNWCDDSQNPHKVRVPPENGPGPSGTCATTRGRHGEDSLEASLETVPIVCGRTPGDGSVVSRPRGMVESHPIRRFPGILFGAIPWARRKVTIPRFMAA